MELLKPSEEEVDPAQQEAQQALLARAAERQDEMQQIEVEKAKVDAEKTIAETDKLRVDTKAQALENVAVEAGLQRLANG